MNHSNAIRIGFYICHCGINIAYRVRVEEVADFVRRLPHVAVARDYKFMCSDPGQSMIEKDIAEMGLNRVVVASCSPRLHGKTFMAACQRAGLNPYYFQMASVREQVSWVTDDEDLATDKAKTLAAAAVNRVLFHQSLQTHYAPVHPDVMVVGGGIAGMQAALDIANGGHRVHLVERDTTIGGHMLQFDKTFPTLDCAACIGTPKMVDVAQNANITLYSLSEVSELSGFVGNFKATIRRRPRYVQEGICTGCGECAKVCPVSIPNSWDQGMAARQAIGRSFPQAIPITFNIEKKDRAPCTLTCPAGINVQGYVQLIGQGKFREAVQLILERLPLPGTLGRVCPHPCEAQCRRAEVDAPVAIRALKRFAADQVDLASLPLPEIHEREEKIAVLGSGPAGLTVANYMRLKGYPITLFESQEQLGGMLRLGIPDYRLPPEVLDREIAHILRLGITVHTGRALGRDFSLADLQAQGFKAVFVGLGAHDTLRLNIPGEDDTPGVQDAVTFLREVNLGRRDAPGDRVVVVGGGNVAVDAARTAKRLGSTRVTVVYRRSREEMPAYEEEIREAEEEGIAFEYLTAPSLVVTDAGRVTGFECLRTELGPPEKDGRRRPVPVAGSEFTIACDAVIPAIGQKTPATGLEELEWTARGRLKVDPHTCQTSLPHVFAAGDMVSGPATVIEAVGAAHQVVAAMDAYVRGEALPAEEEKITAPEEAAHDWAPIPEDVAPLPRAAEGHRTADRRCADFDETALALTAEQAGQEAARCLNCGVCCECMECVKACEAKAIDHRMPAQEVEIPVGSVILATGYDILDPTPLTPYGYGRYPNVFTSLEFERLSNATGPTGGRILTRDADGNFQGPPRSVALVHCVGSRDVNYHEYCSRVCCMYALKYSHLIKEKVGHGTPVYDFYIDMRCYGEGYEEFYRRCQEEGTTFIRGKVAEITDQAVTPEEQGCLVAVAEDTLLGERIRVPVDMVVLCTAIQARSDATELGRVFGVNQGSDGFFLEEHPKLAPLNTATEGVFLAGCCQKPMDIPDTVSQASGAAAKSLSLATLGQVEVSPTISAIDPDICVGCRQCIELCPYGAITFNALKGVSEINPAVCKGCGSCSAFCPSGAASSRHFRSKQVFAEIDGIFDAINRLTG
jgi:heterodisulfide reductase subunit A2